MEIDQEVFLVHVSSVCVCGWLSAFPPEPATSGDDVRGRRRYRRDTRVVARVHELPALMLVRLILLASPGEAGIHRYDQWNIDRTAVLPPCTFGHKR